MDYLLLATLTFYFTTVVGWPIWIAFVIHLMLILFWEYAQDALAQRNELRMNHKNEN